MPSGTVEQDTCQLIVLAQSRHCIIVSDKTNKTVPVICFNLLQIRWSNGDNLQIISICLPNNIYCDLLLEPSYQDSSNTGHNVSLLRKLRKII